MSLIIVFFLLLFNAGLCQNFHCSFTFYSGGMMFASAVGLALVNNKKVQYVFTPFKRTVGSFK